MTNDLDEELRADEVNLRTDVQKLLLMISGATESGQVSLLRLSMAIFAERHPDLLCTSDMGPTALRIAQYRRTNPLEGVQKWWEEWRLQ